MISLLERIVAQKVEEVRSAKKTGALEQARQRETPKIRDFIGALHPTETPAIIAEIKKASPSKGILCDPFNVEEIARSYAEHGARCLSVLTDEVFFQGHPDYLGRAKAQCSLPVLRKDFIIDPYQIDESGALGADCVLLIVALLDDVQLIDFCQHAQELGMAVLVESHTQEELLRALNLPTPLMGINNRNLHTFHTDLQLTLQLQHLIPQDKIIITESGIQTKEDILLLQSCGVNTFLIGEHLIKHSNRGELLKEWSTLKKLS